MKCILLHVVQNQVRPISCDYMRCILIILVLCVFSLPKTLITSFVIQPTITSINSSSRSSCNFNNCVNERRVLASEASSSCEVRRKRTNEKRRISSNRNSPFILRTTTLMLLQQHHGYDYNQLEPVSDSSPSLTTLSSEVNMTSNDDELIITNTSIFKEKEFQFPSDDELNLLPNGKKGGYKVLHQ